MKIDFQSLIVSNCKIDSFMPYSEHKKWSDNPCWGNILYLETSKQKCLQSWTKYFR